MSAQGHVGCGQEGRAPRLLNPGPQSSPLSVAQGEAITRVARAGFLLVDVGEEFGLPGAEPKAGLSKRVAPKPLGEVSQGWR